MSQTMPAVSVIMPVYNCRDYVRTAVESVLAQTFADFELIAVDDGSADGSLDELRQFRDSRLVLLAQDNQGYPAALNAALAKARGGLVARMDADDVSFPERLERQAGFFRQHPDFVLVGTGHVRLTPRGRIADFGSAVAGPGSDAQRWREIGWQDVFNGGKFVDPSAMFRLEAARKAQGYRTYQRSGQDIDLWLRMLESGGRAATLRDALYGWRMSLDSISFQNKGAANKMPRLLASERRERGTDRVMRGEPLDGLLTEQMESGARYWRAVNLWEGARFCFDAGDYRSGWEFARKAAGTGAWSVFNLREAGATGFQIVKQLFSL